MIAEFREKGYPNSRFCIHKNLFLYYNTLQKHKKIK